ncbi:MAG TPA: MarR family transcriptional regulator, partial [Citricoccus sp.]
NLVEITPQGRDLALQAARALNREVFTDLGVPEGEVTTLNAILARLRYNAGDFEEDSPLSAAGAMIDDTGPGVGRTAGTN